jgi:hypothetical protein
MSYACAPCTLRSGTDRKGNTKNKWGTHMMYGPCHLYILTIIKEDAKTNSKVIS